MPWGLFGGAGVFSYPVPRRVPRGGPEVMAIEIPPSPSGTAPADATRIRGLRCRNCGTPEALGPNYVCAACFGPLEVAYDLDLIGRLVSRDEASRRPPGIWRYLELLPLDEAPA